MIICDTLQTTQTYSRLFHTKALIWSYIYTYNKMHLTIRVYWNVYTKQV